jgi:hypothetical protein
MPRDNIDYSNTIIYKIFCKDSNISDMYVGHTTNFIKRKYQHKTLCNSSKKIKMYEIIRENGGWENWIMIEIEKYNCKDSTEARIREQEHYDKLKPSLNKINPITNNPDKICSIDSLMNESFFIETLTNNLENNICSSNNTKKYSCIKCIYYTNNKTDYNKHLTTNKHIEGNSKCVFNNIKVNNKKYICHNCNKIYKDNSGLWKHKQKCEKTKSIELNNTNITSQFTPDLLLSILNHNKTLSDIALEQSKIIFEQSKFLHLNTNS